MLEATVLGDGNQQKEEEEGQTGGNEKKRQKREEECGECKWLLKRNLPKWVKVGSAMQFRAFLCVSISSGLDLSICSKLLSIGVSSKAPR